MRHENWPELLVEYIDAKRNEPFKWGTNDCAVFANGAICSILVDSPTESLCMRYRSSTGAYKWLLDHGADGLWDFVDNYFERIPLVMAGRGDLIAHKTTDESLGVCLGEFYGTPSDNGVLFVAMSDAEFAWRIK